MKKICHILDTIGVGGLEINLLEIVSGLSNYEHHIWCLRDKGELAFKFEERGVSPRALNFGEKNFSRGVFALRDLIKKEHFNIIHSHGSLSSIWARSASLGLKGVVNLVHEQNTYCALTPFNYIKLKALSCAPVKFVAVSEAVKSDLIRIFGIDSRNIRVIYNSSPDMREISGSRREEARRDMGLGQAFVIGSVGRLERHKGHEFLIEAVRICADKRLDVKAVIVGDGPAAGYLKDIAERYGLQGRVLFTGLRFDIARLLSVMDVFVQPSTLVEGLPLVLAEASSMGLPLIATSIGGNAEIVIDDKNGFIVSPRRADEIACKIDILLHDRVTLKKMGESSRRVWEDHFTSERMLKDVSELYDKSSAL